MKRHRDMDRSEVLRSAILRRLNLEDRLREPFDLRRALVAARRMDEFRDRVGPSYYDSTREIRRTRGGSNRCAQTRGRRRARQERGSDGASICPRPTLKTCSPSDSAWIRS